MSKTQHEAAIERVAEAIYDQMPGIGSWKSIGQEGRDFYLGVGRAAYDAARSSRGIDAEIAGLLDRLEDFFLEHHDESAEKLHFYHEIRGVRAARSGEAEGELFSCEDCDRTDVREPTNHPEHGGPLCPTCAVNAALSQHPEPRQDQPVDRWLEIELDRKRFTVLGPEITEQQLRELPVPDVPKDFEIWIELPQADDLVEQARPVTIHGGERFYTTPRQIQPGAEHADQPVDRASGEESEFDFELPTDWETHGMEELDLYARHLDIDVDAIIERTGGLTKPHLVAAIRRQFEPPVEHPETGEREAIVGSGEHEARELMLGRTVENVLQSCHPDLGDCLRIEFDRGAIEIAGYDAKQLRLTWCAPGGGLRQFSPPEPLQDGGERETYSANLDREQALSAYSQQTGSEEIPASAIEPAEAFRAGWDACSARHPHQDVGAREFVEFVASLDTPGATSMRRRVTLTTLIRRAQGILRLAPSPDDRPNQRQVKPNLGDGVTYEQIGQAARAIQDYPESEEPKGLPLIPRSVKLAQNGFAAAGFSLPGDRGGER